MNTNDITTGTCDCGAIYDASSRFDHDADTGQCWDCSDRSPDTMSDDDFDAYLAGWDCSDRSPDTMTNDPIVIVMEGGLVQGIYCAEGQPLTRPVVVIDYDTEGMDDDNENIVPIPQNAEGDTSNAWVAVHGQAEWLNPVIAEFVTTHIV